MKKYVGVAVVVIIALVLGLILGWHGGLINHVAAVQFFWSALKWVFLAVVMTLVGWVLKYFLDGKSGS